MLRTFNKTFWISGLILFFLCSATSIWAKPGLVIKASGGMTHSTNQNSDKASQWGLWEKSILSANTSVSATILLTRNIGLEVGYGRSSSGAKTDNMIGTDDKGAELGNIYAKRKFEFTDIPIHFVYQAGGGKIAPFVLIGTTIKLVDKGTDSVEFDYDEEDWTNDISDRLNDVNTCMDLGFGLTYKINRRLDAGFSVRNIFGTKNLFKKGDPEEFINRDWLFTGSLSYRIF